MWYSLATIITLANYILSITSCKIKVKMQSKTDKPFQIQIYVPAIKMKTERIKGEKCDEKHWIIKTWKKIDNKWIPAKETKAKFEGLGSFGISVKDDLLPQITNRFAVACSEGNC
uniref:Bm7214 n=1 Tax=Brugia malayi TaxID=6279 RepID=A0A0J9XRZ5_BRUMA|nr:Bm7214 [Brugia malayi]